MRLKLAPSKTFQNYTRNSKFGTKVQTRMQFQKIYQDTLNFADVNSFLEKKNSLLKAIV